MQASMAENRPLLPCHNSDQHNSDQLKPSYLMMTSQLVQRSSELALTINSSTFYDSRGIQWQDHSTLVQPHGIIERRDQLVHGCYFVKTEEEDLFMARMGRNLHGAGTTASSGGAYQETGNANRFCSTEKSSSKGSKIPYCQAEGCNENLSSAKQYYRRLKVCELHSKASAVSVCGLIQRFCQQCSRFHLRSQFDGRKRSCRKSLADHNRRRRKPQASPCTASECEAATTYLEDGNQKTNGSSAHEATDSLGELNFLRPLNLECYLCYTTPFPFEDQRTKFLS